MFDHHQPASDLTFDLFVNFSIAQTGPYTNIAATGPRSFLVAPSNFGTFPSLIDASNLGSDFDPSRTMTFSGANATLVDTTQALVESYDAQGRMVQRDLRTGEPLISVSYVDSTSDGVAALTDPDGNQTIFTYDAASSKLSSIRDPAGRVTQFGRSSTGDLTSMTEPDGEVVTFQYDDAHHMTSKTARGTDTTTYVYNADGSVHSATKPAGETTTITASLSAGPQYSATGALITSGTYTDAHGVAHTFVTDTQGQIQTDSYTADGVAYTRALSYATQLNGTSTEFAARSNNNLLRVAYTTLNGVPLGRTQHYDSFGRLVSEDGQATSDRRYTYDSNGWLSDVFIGPSDYDQRITRDAAGHPLRIYDEYLGNPEGREEDFAWARSDGQPSAIVKHSVTYMLSYDDSGPLPSHNLTGIVDTLGRTATFAYDSGGNVAVASDGATTNSFAYDSNNRLLVAADALSNQTVLGYTQVNCGCSDQDEVTSVHTPDLEAGQQWSLTYGAEGRLATVSDPDGQTEAYSYEPTGELHSVIDRDGNMTTIGHDQLGRVLGIVDGLGRTHARAYTVPASGVWSGPTLTSGSASATPASTSLTAALSVGDYQIGRNLYQTQGYPANISFYRDATFQLSFVDKWDDGMRPTLHRARDGEPVSSTDTTSATSSFVSEVTTYTPLNGSPIVTGLTSPRPPSANDGASLNYNTEFDVTSDTGYGSSITNQVAYGYTRDTGGRLTGVSRSWTPISGTFFSADNQSYAYLPNGKLQTYTGPDGTKSYTYDTRGLVQSLTVTIGSTVEHWSFDYDPMGRSAHVSYPDGHVRTQLYDAEGRLASRCYQYGSGDYCYTATYDGAGNPVTMSDPYGGSESYTYDALNRLTGVTRTFNGVADHQESYSYNAIGAVKTTYDPLVASAVTLDDQRPLLSGGGSGDAAVPNTLDGQTVTLDGGGRVTSLDGVTFTYDERSRVTGTQYTSGSNTVTETYGYDTFLRRVQRLHKETSPSISVSSFYVFDGANLVATVAQGGALQDAYLFAEVDHPLRLLRGGSSYFYEVDLAGNVRRLRDSSGADLGGYRYTAFGVGFPADAQAPAPAIAQPLQWKGRWYEGVAGGMYEMRARWWSPRMGAFLAVDSYRFHDARTTLWGWPGSNPMARSDPTGHSGWFWGITGGGEAGLGIGGGANVGGGQFSSNSGPTSGTEGTYVSGGISTPTVGVSAGIGLTFGYFFGSDPSGPGIDIHGANPGFSWSVGTSGISITVGPSVGASVGVGLGGTFVIAPQDAEPGAGDAPDASVDAGATEGGACQ